MAMKYKGPKGAIAITPIRGVREASIDVAAPGTIAGVHRTTFVDRYDFGFWLPRDAGSPGQYSSLIHGNVPSRGVNVEVGPINGTAAYFNHGAPTLASDSDETFQTFFSPPDAAGQAIQNPAWGCRKMSCAFNVQATVPAADMYTLGLYRACNPADSLAYLGGMDVDLLINEWGPFPASVAGVNACALIVQDYSIPVGSSFYFRLRNTVNPASTNALMGSLYLHG